MLLRSVFVLCLLTISLYAQSMDEEESVHVGGEGSGNAMTDDEDLEGSSLPPDTFYATTPQVRPRASTPSTTTTKVTPEPRATTTVVRQRITTFGPSTPRITTRTETPTNVMKTTPSSELSLMGAGNTTIVLILGSIITILVILILVVICCKAYNNRKQAYRPGQRQSPDALLKESG